MFVEQERELGISLYKSTLNGSFKPYLISNISVKCNYTNVQWLDMNPGPLVLEATALSTVPQPPLHLFKAI